MSNGASWHAWFPGADEASNIAITLQFCEISKKELAVSKISHNYAQILVCVSVGYYLQNGYILTVPQHSHVVIPRMSCSNQHEANP